MLNEGEMFMQRVLSMFIALVTFIFAELDLYNVEDAMNGKFKEYVNDTTKGCYGIALLDFVDSELCEKVIQTNF